MVTSDIIQNGAVLNFIHMMSLISVIHSLSTSATSHDIHGYFREKIQYHQNHQLPFAETTPIAHVWKVLHGSKALGFKLQIFHDSIFSNFPEETWAHKKKQTNQI